MRMYLNIIAAIGWVSTFILLVPVGGGSAVLVLFPLMVLPYSIYTRPEITWMQDWSYPIAVIIVLTASVPVILTTERPNLTLRVVGLIDLVVIGISVLVFLAQLAQYLFSRQ